jgi:uncharacterized protein YeaO (DUF488 family)
MIRTKRAYEPADRKDGFRVLADRLWPRGLAKADARIDLWAKALAPSDALRRWYGHEPERWPEFRRRYFAELEANAEVAEVVEALLAEAHRGTLTLVFSSKEPRLNNASALKEWLEGQGDAHAPRGGR